MAVQRDSEIDDLWSKYSKDDLWKHVSEWWEAASGARVVMLLAMNHKQSLSLTEMIEKAGVPEANVRKVLKELQDEGVVECHGQPATYSIADEAAFLRHMQQCCERTAVAAGMIGTLAGWAGGS